MSEQFTPARQRAADVADAYDAADTARMGRTWSTTELALGLVGDVGDLAKIVMSLEDVRSQSAGGTDELEHELCDVLWSCLVLADRYGIDLDTAFPRQMDALLARMGGGAGDGRRAARARTYVPLGELDPAATYAYGPDSSPKARVRPGRVREFTLDDSAHFPGTTRRVWTHVPADHDAASPAAVMFFIDGWWYLDPAGDVRGGTVLDNLAAARDVPPMVAVFVDPGVRASDAPGAPAKNRNVEYDADDARFADFLMDEVLPVVAQEYRLLNASDSRGICGGSSGGNAALTAAWHRSERIGKASCFNPSFAQMPGGNPYPSRLRDQPRRAIRVLLHAAHRDLNWDRPTDNWFAESLATAAALAAGGYDFRLVVGEGGHHPNHGGVLLPDALRWLWR